MAGAVQFQRTHGAFYPAEPAEIKRGGGGGKGGNAAHVTQGNMNEARDCAPPGYGLTQYLRRFFNNVAGLSQFAPPTSFKQTENNTISGGAPRDPIPWDRRWYSPTYRPPWYRPLWTVYVPNELINLQRGVVPRVVDNQRQMGKPYPNLLTVYRRYPPYSNQTKVLGKK